MDGCSLARSSRRLPPMFMKENTHTHIYTQTAKDAQTPDEIIFCKATAKDARPPSLPQVLASVRRPAATSLSMDDSLPAVCLATCWTNASSSRASMARPGAAAAATAAASAHRAATRGWRLVGRWLLIVDHSSPIINGLGGKNCFFVLFGQTKKPNNRPTSPPYTQKNRINPPPSLTSPPPPPRRSASGAGPSRG